MLVKEACVFPHILSIIHNTYQYQYWTHLVINSMAAKQHERKRKIMSLVYFMLLHDIHNHFPTLHHILHRNKIRSQSYVSASSWPFSHLHTRACDYNELTEYHCNGPLCVPWTLRLPSTPVAQIPQCTSPISSALWDLCDGSMAAKSRVITTRGIRDFLCVYIHQQSKYLVPQMVVSLSCEWLW